MEENQGQGQDPNSPKNNNHHGSSSERSGGEPVRSRWTPKPEQILILESIFNSGMVNPPKDETVRIRKLLEKFGAVGDANVFYWFQNRRSRSRRRQRQLQASLQRQLQASLIAEEQQRNQQQQEVQASTGSNTGAILYEGGGASVGFANSASAAAAASCFVPPPPSFLVGPSSSSCGMVGDDGAAESLFSIPNQLGFQEMGQTTGVTSILCPSETSNLHYQTGFITVFINGVATEVPRGPLDMKAMFGQDVILVHSSGIAVPTNEFGYLMQSLQHGESYFLVSRPT